MSSAFNLFALAGLALASLTQLSAKESISKAEQTFHRISTQLKSGKGEAALESMTSTAAESFLRLAMLSVADAVILDEEIPKTWLDGTPVATTPASLGFDTFKFPKWYLNQNGSGGSAEQTDSLEKSLLSLLDQTPDRSAALKSLYLMSEAIYPGELSAKVVPPKDGIAPSPNRVWVDINNHDGEIEHLPLLFKQQGQTLKYAGIDEHFIAQQRRLWRFIEKEELPLAGLAYNGKEVKLADYKDKVVLLDFWGTT